MKKGRLRSNWAFPSIRMSAVSWQGPIEQPLWQKLRRMLFQHQNINHQLQNMKSKTILLAAAISLLADQPDQPVCHAGARIVR
jgi:hypothetical protein